MSWLLQFGFIGLFINILMIVEVQLILNFNVILERKTSFTLIIDDYNMIMTMNIMIKIVIEIKNIN